ncbi:MAG TPA: hypothetical protein VFX49_06425, partial [Chloroflexota bacterium]|nr:hypothetical protein [Chloroflexota bacterium]
QVLGDAGLGDPRPDVREQLLAYVRSRISEPGVAEDLLQDSLLKALRAVPDSLAAAPLTPERAAQLCACFAPLARRTRSRASTRYTR